MNLIHRHILWSVIKASAAAVALFTFILLTGNAIREILAFLLDGRMDILLFLHLIGLLLPFVISYALPMGVLMGVLMVLGRMCAQGEYTAYRACGVSLGYLARPVWLFAILCAVCLMGVNFYYAPMARSGYYTTLSAAVREDPLKFILPQTFVKEFPGYILYARERHGAVLKDFWIWELDSHNRPLKLVRSRQGMLKFDPNDDSLVLDLTNGFSELRDAKNPDDLKTIRPTLSFDHANVKLPLNRLTNGQERGGLTVLTIDKLLKLKKELEAEVRSFEALRETTRTTVKDISPLAAKKNSAAPALKAAAPNPAEMEISPEANHATRVRLTQVDFQIQQSLAFACAVLALCLVGVPLGIKASRKETSANLAIALGLAMGYYFLIVMTSWASKTPAIHPEILVWLPNLLFFAIGVTMLRKMQRNG